MVTDSTVYTIVGGIVAVLGLLWLWLESKYKYKVIMKDIVQGRTITREYKAQSWVDSDKSAWWKLAGERDKEKKLIPQPPENCIDITYKGRKIVHAYRLESGEIIFCRDDWKTIPEPKFDLTENQILLLNKEPDKIVKIELQKKYIEENKVKWYADNKVISPFQPVTTNQRMGFFANIRKAEERKKFDWKSQLVTITGIAGLVLIVLGLMIFYGEIAKPVLEANGQVLAMEKEHTLQLQSLEKISQLLQDIKLNQQTIKPAPTP